MDLRGRNLQAAGGAVKQKKGGRRPRARPAEHFAQNFI
jgi:hypothetical protein